jgi:hypothetical protein
VEGVGRDALLAVGADRCHVDGWRTGHGAELFREARSARTPRVA